MKKRYASSLLLLFFTLIFGVKMLPVPAMAADAPPIVGDWEGTLDPGAQPKKHILVHIAVAQDGTLSGTIDYPDQETSGILINAITYKEPALHFESTGIPGFYDGTMNKENSQITGTWKQQGGPGVPLVLKRIT